MKRIVVVAALVATAGGLAGCGRSHSPDEGGGAAAPAPNASGTPQAAAPAAPVAPPGSGAPVPAADREAALRTAVEGYTNALLAANAPGMSGYFDRSCTPSDIATTVYAAREVKVVAKGATVKVTGVVVHGDRGQMTTYELSPGAPDALRRMLKAAQETEDADPWRYVDGEWYFTGVCGTTPGLMPVPATPTEKPAAGKAPATS